MDYSKQKDKSIILTEKGKVRQFFIDTIMYIECDGYTSTLHRNNGDKPETFSILLKVIEKEVDGFGFFRINRNTIVNLRYFKSFVTGQERFFIIEDGTEMKISRRRWYVFKKTIKR